MGKLFATSNNLVDFALEPEVKAGPYSEIEFMILLDDHIPYERFNNVSRKHSERISN